MSHCARNRRFGFRLTGLVLGMVSAAPVALAQQAASPPESEAAVSPKWAVQCTNPGQELVCQAIQTVYLRKTGQRLISVSIKRTDPTGSATMLLQLPHGLYLPNGVQVKIDSGDAASLAIQTCDLKGCYVGTTRSPAQITAMKKGRVLAVTFQNLKKQPITIQVPLTGFTAAYAKLD